MSERRFTEDEVETILKNAAEVQHSDQGLVRAASGLTLAELEEIGREAGISAEAVQHAVRRLEKPDQPTKTFLGFPIAVGTSVELNRTLSDEDWDRLVVELRETFNARGLVTREGSLRTWRNGNLQVLLEPTPTGQRLRMRTLRGGARELMIGGAAMTTFSVAAWTAAVLQGPISDAGFLAAVGTLAVGGLGMFAAGSLRLPGWARMRRKQMDQIAERVESTK